MPGGSCAGSSLHCLYSNVSKYSLTGMIEVVTHCVNREGDVPGMSLCTHMNISMNSLWVLGMRPDVHDSKLVVG